MQYHIQYISDNPNTPRNKIIRYVMKTHIEYTFVQYLDWQVIEVIRHEGGGAYGLVRSSVQYAHIMLQ